MANRIINESVETYLDNLPQDRKEIVTSVREVIIANLPAGYEEGILYGMICYFVPLDRYPDTYNKQPLMLAGIASRKSYLSLHLVAVYGKKELNEWLVEEWSKTGKKLNMGKGCIHFKKIDDLPLELIAKTIAKVPVSEFITLFEKK